MTSVNSSHRVGGLRHAAFAYFTHNPQAMIAGRKAPRLGEASQPRGNSPMILGSRARWARVSIPSPPQWGGNGTETLAQRARQRVMNCVNSLEHPLSYRRSSVQFMMKSVNSTFGGNHVPFGWTIWYNISINTKRLRRRLPTLGRVSELVRMRNVGFSLRFLYHASIAINALGLLVCAGGYDM